MRRGEKACFLNLKCGSETYIYTSYTAAEESPESAVIVISATADLICLQSSLIQSSSDVDINLLPDTKKHQQP